MKLFTPVNVLIAQHNSQKSHKPNKSTRDAWWGPHDGLD